MIVAGSGDERVTQAYPKLEYVSKELPRILRKANPIFTDYAYIMHSYHRDYVMFSC